MSWSPLPASWSNKNKVERLDHAAFESLSRMLNRAVADTGVNFSIWSAGRSREDQIAIFKKNYTPAGRGRRLKSDRSFQGRIWKKRTGGVNVASPDLGSNHEDGLAVDIHPAPIQEWIKKNGRTYGWSWDEGRRVGENWHFRYVPSLDGMKHEGLLDHAWVQKVVGASVDGKIGTGTVAKIKAWQKAHGLTVDGKVGAGTKAAMAGKAPAADTAPVVEAAPKATVQSVQAAPAFKLVQGPWSPNITKTREDKIRTVTVHWWGTWQGQSHEGTVAYLAKDRPNGTSAHYVVSPGLVTQIVDESAVAWANGNRKANHHDISLELCPDPDRMTETMTTAAALIKDIRSRHGDLSLHGHRDWYATECPGAYYKHLPEIDAMARGHQATVIVQKAAPVATQKKVNSDLMAVLNTPDFPLLRTASHKCYYGPKSGPRESVSGHMENSLAPGDVKGNGSEGLRTYQRQLVKRGYSLAIDGKYGNDTANATKNIQRLAGITQDGKIGPDAWHAAFLMEVR